MVTRFLKMRFGDVRPRESLSMKAGAPVTAIVLLLFMGAFLTVMSAPGMNLTADNPVDTFDSTPVKTAPAHDSSAVPVNAYRERPVQSDDGAVLSPRGFEAEMAFLLPSRPGYHAETMTHGFHASRINRASLDFFFISAAHRFTSPSTRSTEASEHYHLRV